MTFTRPSAAQLQQQREERRAANLKALATPSRALTKGSYEGRVSGESIKKDHPMRSEPYRRLVAAMPCANCGIEGHSQAAHPTPTGKGIKEDDRLCFPLCADRPMQQGCHSKFDQYKLIPKHLMDEYAADWGFLTRGLIAARGLWPANLPRWEDRR